MVDNTYDSIEEVRGSDEIIFDDVDSRKTTCGTNKKVTYFGVGSLVMICLVAPFLWLGYIRNNVAAKSIQQQSTTTVTSMAGIAPVTVVLMGKSTSHPNKDGIRDCTFEECKATACDISIAPYKCLKHNGGPHGGCSSIPWTIDTCDDQCDMKSCATQRIPHSEKSCKKVTCPKDTVCTDARLCPHDVQFQCIEGSANFGCSADKYLWAYKTSDATCSKCCDTSTCK